MTMVSVRVPDPLLAEARRFSINVSAAFRHGLEVELRKARVLANVATLAAIAKKPAASGTEQVRRLRDGRA